MGVVRILIWNVADSKTTVSELRAHLDESTDGTRWIVNEAAERFGLIAFGELPPSLENVRALIGKEPDVAEEFDVA